MLMLGRNPEEYVVIGDNIVVKVVSADGALKLAIDAPKQISILREELSEAEQSNKTALSPNINSVMLLQSLLKKQPGSAETQQS